MTKQEQIEVKKLKPIEVGDYVGVEVQYTSTVSNYIGRGKNKTLISEEVDNVFKTQGYLIAITDDKYEIGVTSVSVPFQLKGIVDSKYVSHNQTIIVNKDIVFPTFLECGVNPFGKEKRRIQFYNQEIQSLLYKLGWEKKSVNNTNDWQKINFDPFVIDVNGEKQFYQRGLVWTLEQKQLLIESIYNDIEIGKFLLRYNSWKRMEKEEAETGVMHSWDCVDGKQRLNTILSFVNNEFQDANGYFWDDLSSNAHRRFFNYGNLSYGELPESASDEDVIDNFLTLNFTGVPMSQEHIDYVKTIKMS